MTDVTPEAPVTEAGKRLLTEELHVHFGLPRGQCPDRCGGVAGHSGYHQSSDHAAIKRDARAEAVARDREALAAKVGPKRPAPRTDFDHGWNDCRDFVLRLAATPSPAPTAPLDLEYESRVTAMAVALHEDCRLEWQARRALGEISGLTQHDYDAHFGKAHDLVRRLFPELDPAATPDQRHG